MIKQFDKKSEMTYEIFPFKVKKRDLLEKPFLGSQKKDLQNCFTGLKLKALLESIGLKNRDV